MINKKAFTLTEIIVVITLLGVLSAIVIPSTIKNYQRKLAITRLKIAYTMLIKLAETSAIENRGIPSGSDHWNDNDWNKYVKPYLKINKDCGMIGYKGSAKESRCFAAPNGGWYTPDGYEIGMTASTDSTGNAIRDEDGNIKYEYSTTDPYSTSMFHKVVLSNGMSLAFSACDGCASVHTIFVVDIDGPYKGYSKLGQDVFLFEWVNPKTFDYGERNPNVKEIVESTVVPYVAPTYWATQGGWYSYFYNNSRIIYLKDSCIGNGKSNTMGWDVKGGSCAAWIIANDWKFPKDYPWDIVDAKPDGFVPVER